MKRSPLKRKTGLTRRTQVKRVSAKRAVTNRKRAAFRREQLAVRTLCEAPQIAARIYASHRPTDLHRSAVHAACMQVTALCQRVAVDLHEPLTRARAPGEETILDPANSVAICRPCHDWIHAHPEAATLLGLLKSGHGGGHG